MSAVTTSTTRAVELLARVVKLRSGHGNRSMGDWLDGYQSALQAGGGAAAIVVDRSKQYLAGVAAGRRDLAGPPARSRGR